MIKRPLIWFIVEYFLAPFGTGITLYAMAHTMLLPITIPLYSFLEKPWLTWTNLAIAWGLAFLTLLICIILNHTARR